MASTEKLVTENDDRRGDVLLEKLRSKANHMKPWGDSIKAFRIALLDKRCTMDSAERLQIQKCLDTLQKTIKVTSLQSMVERLESITRQLSLKFLAGPTGTDCFISSDMFYVEVLLEINGSVKDVKIAHHGDPVSCPELSEVLSAGDFTEFTKHLEGLAAIYQLNADKKQKSKAYLALQALETDLSMLAQLQSSINEPSNFVHKSPVGILQPRKGGHPMKLTYFISPYDLLDMETKSSIPLTVETVIERQLGYYVTVCIESSTSHKLQTQSLMSISRTPDGKSLPSFAAPSNLNSTTLPASFVLKLATPVPIAVALVRKIQAVTCIECADMSTSQPLLSLITNHASNGELDCSNNKGLFVVLPDQHHCYFLNGAPDLQGVMVSSIPFTHPTHVPQILVFLRQQMLFNVLISSCIRTCSKQDLETALMFEVTALSWLHISVSFEHPLEESMATAEFDLTDITNVKCKLYTMSSDASICSDEYASKVIQRCLSIPVTMRAVIRKAQGQQKKCNQSNEDLYLTMVMGNSGKFSNHPPSYSDSSSSSKFVSDFDMKLNRSGNRSSDSQSIGKLDMLNSNMSTSSYSVSSPDLSTSSLGLESQTYIDSSSPAHGDLFSLNSDRSGGVISPRFSQSHSNQVLNSVPGKSSLVNNHQLQLGNLVGNSSSIAVKPRKERGKRKNTSEGSSPRSNTGRSPKRKHNEDDNGKEMQDLESNGNSLSISYGLNMEISTPSGNTSSGGMDCESHVSKLASSLDSIIKYEGILPRNSSDVSMNNEHEIHRSNSSSVASLHDLIDKTSCESSVIDSELFNNSSQNRNIGNEYQYKSEPIDFETEVMNQNSSFDESLIEGTDEFNLEQLGINTSLITTKVTTTTNSGGEKTKENKKLKKIKLEIPPKLEKEHGGGSENEKQPPPVILDIISSQMKVIETSKSSSVVDLTEKRPSVEIIPIGNVNSSSSSTTSLLGPGIKIVNPAVNSNKVKQREFRRGVTISERNDKKSKGEGKRERKRKHLESLNGSDEKPTNIFGLSITPLPPKTSASISLAEQSLPKSITVSMKPITSPTSGPSNSQSNKILTSKKPQLPAGTTVSPTKSVSILKTPQGNKLKPSVKSSSSGKSMQVVGIDSKTNLSSKIAVSPLKMHNKFKSNSGNNNSSASSGKSGNHSPTVQNNSPSKVCTKPATVKLKQLNIPNSTTVTPINKICSPTNTSSPSTSVAATLSLSSVSSSLSSNSSLSSLQSANTSSVTLVTSPTITTPAITKSLSLPATTMLVTNSSTNNAVTVNSSSSNAHYSNSNSANTENENGNNNSNGSVNSSKQNKSLNRSRKGSLSAVIDKLMASNRQTNTPGGENQQFQGEKKTESKGEVKEFRQDKKESFKDSSGTQKTNDKPKMSSVEQKSSSEKKPEFTVKQSSQGIKLTVTKTRCTEGGTKLSSSLKTSSSGSSSSSNSSSGNKSSSNSKTNSGINSSTKSSGASGSATGLKPGVNSGPASKKLHSSSAKTSSSNISSSGNNPTSAQNRPSLPVPKTNTSISSTKTQSSHSSSTFKPSPKHGSSERSSSNSIKSQDKYGKSPVHESRPSTPKLEKSSATGLTNMPPPPAPCQTLDVGLSLRKSEEISGRSNSGRQTSKGRDSQLEETEAERQFRLLLAETKMETQSTSTSSLSVSNTVKPPSSVTSMVTSITGNSSDRPEGSRTPKQDLSDKSPKHTSTDGRTTPKNLTEKSLNFAINAVKCVQSENKRPSTPKLGELMQKTTEGLLPVVSSPVDLNMGKLIQSQSSSTVIKPKAKCLSSPSHEDISSPEGSLIIDYPGTPHQKSPDKKLIKNPIILSSESTVSNSQTKSPDKLSPSSLIMNRSPSQSSPSIKSPAILGTPQSDHSNPSSVARSSPCVIDDDLMDEALIGIGK